MGARDAEAQLVLGPPAQEQNKNTPLVPPRSPWKIAEPLVLHSFLFLVLAVLCVPMLYRNAIMSMYTRITAYSSGIGDGSFLFNVLCGVKAGCPLSSILSILCINPFIDVF